MVSTTRDHAGFPSLKLQLLWIRTDSMSRREYHAREAMVALTRTAVLTSTGDVSGMTRDSLTGPTAGRFVADRQRP